MHIIIGGALGRMGRQLAALAADAGVTVACGVDTAYQGQPWAFPLVKAYAQAPEGADVLVDFSRPEGLEELLALCESRGMPAVLCATGYTPQELDRIRLASQSVPLLRSANMSLGINLMEQLVATAAKALGQHFDIEIVETHHRMKADSPSGTALMLYDAAREQLPPPTQPIYGRHSRKEARQRGDIGLHAVRGGTVTGEHQVGFYGEGEQLLLVHRAESRTLFAQGALTAAQFLLGKAPGLYTMRDVVEGMLEGA